MRSETPAVSPTPVFVGIIAFVVVVAALRLSNSLVLPWILALFAALIVQPSIGWMRRHKVPLGVAVALVVLGALGVLFLFGLVIGSSLQDFSDKLPLYQHQLTLKLRAFEGLLANYTGHTSVELLQGIDPGKAMGFAAGLLNGLSAALTNGFLILFVMVLMLFDFSTLPERVAAAFPDSRAPLRYATAVAESLRRYILVKTAISLITGLLVGLSMAALGLDFPVLWGLLAFLLNYIPNIGSILAAVPSVLLAFIEFGPGRSAAVALVYVLINLVIGYAIEPRVTGRSLGLSTLVVFLSLLFWGWVFGPVGMLISIPLTMTIKLAFESNPRTRPIARLLDSRIAPREEAQATA